jgi:serine/threonine-protein phosphatase 2B regulatory subunit
MGNVNTTQDNQIDFDKNELKILYKNFVKLDIDKSGTIEPSEFFNVPELKDNPIVQRIISVFDKNGDGKISFYEFVIGLSTLSSGHSTEDKIKFAFEIYDMNEDGFISNGDLFACLKLLVGDNLTDIQIQQLVDRTIIQADKDLDGKLSFDEFKTFISDLKMEDLFSMNLFK